MFWTHEENSKNLNAEVLVSKHHTLIVKKSASWVNSKNGNNKSVTGSARFATGEYKIILTIQNVATHTDEEHLCT
jgi:hypothetical protein